MTDGSATPRARLRMGVVGCGAVTERYHLPALMASPDITLAAFVDPAVERAEHLAARTGAPLALADYAELAGKVDLALIAVPNALHARIAVDLLRAGLHVLVEKPMARTTAECDQMLAAAVSTGAVLAVGHDFRHYPVARYAHAFFAAGLLGRIERVDVEQSAGGRWPAVSTAMLRPEAGGGILIDFGVHVFDLLLWWLGDMRVTRYRDDALGGVEAECEGELALASGAPVTLTLSRTRELRDTVIVHGERGSVEIGVFEPAVFRVTLRQDGPPLDGAISDAEFARAPLQTVFARQLADMVAAIRERRPPLVTGQAGRRVVALAEECYRVKQLLTLPWDYPAAYAAIGQAAGRTSDGE